MSNEVINCCLFPPPPPDKWHGSRRLPEETKSSRRQWISQAQLNKSAASGVRKKKSP